MIDLVAQTRKILNLPEAKSASAHSSDAQADAVDGTSRGAALPVSAGRAPGAGTGKGCKPISPSGPTPGDDFGRDPDIAFDLTIDVKDIEAKSLEELMCEAFEDLFPHFEVTDFKHRVRIEDNEIRVTLWATEYRPSTAAEIARDNEAVAEALIQRALDAHKEFSPVAPLSSSTAQANGAGAGSRPAPPPEAA